MPTSKRLLTQPEDWWAAFQKQATKEGASLAEWVGECCVAHLSKSDRNKLSERRRVGAPKRKGKP